MSIIRRFFHWGPITAIGIIKCVTFMTLYMNSMWWPPTSGFYGFLNQAVFLILSSLAAFNYIMATITGPGFLPLQWKPKKSTDIQYLQYCGVCDGYKAPRSHHCRKCGRCVKKMDHHCPWINSCVGWANHSYFTCFLGFAVIGCIHASIILVASFYRGIHRNYYIYTRQPHLANVQFSLITLILCIFSLGLAVGVVIAVGMLLYFQLRAIVRNRTAIEDWIVEKATYRRRAHGLEPFIFPYDLGVRENMKQVLNWNCEPIGDGITWKLKKDSEQYVLTIEQIEQKKEKRCRSEVRRVIKKSTGNWIPVFSQSCKVSLSPPCTDEPRMKLELGDYVIITRWRKHWLYGEKTSSPVGERKQGLRRERGWFPRVCVEDSGELLISMNDEDKADEDSKKSD